jgi:gliding motility-associated-like protein
MVKRLLGLTVILLTSLFASAQSDNCSPATTYNTVCAGVAGSNIGATTGPEDSYAAADICAGTLENTVWYTFTAPAAATYTFTFDVGTCASGFGLQTGVLSGPCGGPYTSLNCSYAGTGLITSYNVALANGQQVWVVIDGDGGDQCLFTFDVCATACTADVGTFTFLIDGVVSASPAFLCSGGANCVDIISNNDFVLPPPQPGELSELMYALYTCPPTTADPATDPCYSGLLWSGQDFADCNPSTYGLVGTYYFVPITADDSDDGGDPNGVINWDQNGDGCFDLGAPLQISYLNDIATVATQDCSNGTVAIVVTGGAPEFGGGSYAFVNTGSGTLTGTPIGHGGTVTITGLNNGDSYSISISGAGGCPSVVASGTFVTATITNISTVDPTCGLSNGSITISGTGTGGGLTYSIDNGVTFQASNTFTGLPAGTYDIVLLDGNGCTAAQQVVLTTTPVPSITSVAVIDPTCGINNGSITITASGGTAPLTYSNDNGVTFQASNVFSGLAPGTYDLVVEDANGCQATQQVVLTNIPSPTITNIATVDPTCGNSNGSIAITASGGTPPLTYSIDNGVTFQASNAFSGLPAGTYDVVVEDANGCQATQQVVLTNIPGPTITNIATVDPTCGNSNGSIAITASGGTPPLTYSVDNGVTFQASNAFSGLPAGTYDVVVEDANGCQATQQVILTNSAAPTISNIATVDPTCGNSNGSITITASGGTAPLAYSVDNGVTFQASNAFSGLPAGTYDVVVEDANGCQATQQVVLTNSAAPTISNIATVDPTCGNSNGSITITASGGTAPLAYSVDNGVTFQASNVFSGLAPGTYDLVVEDANGCQATQQVVLTNIPGPTITNIATVNPSCGAADGSITISASGGTAPLQYSIDNGVTFQASNVFSGLSAGTYDIVVEDANGCQATQQVVLTNSAAPTITNIAVVAPTCAGVANATVTITASGGTPPLQYSIDNGSTFQASNVFSGLPAGTYDIVVEDALGCQAAQQLIISEPSLLTVVISGQDPSCDGSCDGLYVATAGGGTAGYTYLWNDGTVNPNCPGQCDGATITVTLTDANGCVATDTYIIPDITPVTYAATVAEDTCGMAVGEIVLTGSGGLGAPYSYSNDNGATSQASNTFSGLGAGNYDIVITDANGCTTTGLEVVGTISGASITNIATVDPTCGANNGSVTITASGGTAPLQYSVDNGITFQASNVFTNLSAGNYDVVVEDAAGCQATQVVTLTAANGPSITNIAAADPSCGASDGSITITATGGTAPLVYSIDNGSTWQASNVFTNLTAGSFDVIVEDALGCQTTQTVVLNSTAGPSISNIAAVDPSCGVSNGSITITASGGTAPLEYSIDNGVTFQASNVIIGLGNGSYDVVVQDASGCQATQTVVLSGDPAMTYTATITDENCGSFNGSILLAASGGDGGPYQYSIDGGGTFQASGTFAGLAAGIYNIVISDGSGCQTTNTETVSALGGPTIDALLLTDPSCAGACDGIAIVQVSGGTAPYSYQWYDPLGTAIPGATNDTLTGLCDGNYSIEVNDATGGSGGPFWNEDFGIGCDQGNLANTFVSVNGAWSVNNTVGPNDPLANQFYVSATEAGMGTGNCGDGCLGTPGLTNRSLHVANVAGSPASLLCPTGDCGAAYDATVTTNVRTESPVINCVGQTGITLSFDYILFGEAGDDEASLHYFDGATWTAITNPLPQTICCGGPCTGLFSQGQWTNYTVVLPASADNNPAVQLGLQWTNSNNNSGADPSFALDDLVLSTVGGGVACPLVSSLTITEPAVIGYTVTIVDETCAALGSIDIAGSGGDGGPYTYSSDNGSTFQASGFFGSLPAGNYDIVVQDASGCTISGIATVGTPAPGPIISSQTFNAPLCNGDTGNVSVSATGAPPLQFSIDGGGTFQPGGSFGNLAAGTYEVIIEDANGCQDTAFFTITDPALLVLNPIVIDETCIGNNGSIDGNGSGGSGALEYSLNGGALQANSVFGSLLGGSYVILVEDANGCQATAQVVVNTGAGPTLQGVTTSDPSCGSLDGFIDIDVLGNAPFQYSVDGGVTFQGAAVFTGLGAGIYDIVITDVDGCATTTQATLNSGVPVAANCSATPTTGLAPLVVNFGNTSTGATSYEWDFDDGVTSIDTFPSHTFTTNGTYNVMLVASNGNPSCNDTCYVTILVEGESSMTIPNVFSPNGDGVNDVFRITNTGMQDFNCTIFNRWGQKVYEWNGPGGVWDGRTAPAGQPAPEGTYFWFLTAEGDDGQTYEEHGSLTLVR